MTPDQIKAMSNKPTPLPDVERINTEIDWDNLYILRDHIRTLLATIPRDKSSAAYAMWLMAQGYKIRKDNWGNKEQYVRFGDDGPRWADGTKFDLGLNNNWAGEGAWLIYEEPPAVDDDELRRKCAKFALAWATYVVADDFDFTPAELQRLKELL